MEHRNSMECDRIVRAMCAEETVRIIAIDGKQLVTEARRIHNLSRVATAALGRQLMMTAILASTLKGEGERVSTILNGGGPGGSLVCTGDAAGNVKGCLQDPTLELPPTAEGKLDVAGLVGRAGKLTVVRDMGLREPYVGTCNLISGEIAMDFAQYFTVSEQTPSLCYLGVREDAADGAVRAAAGLLLQPMPGCPDETIDRMQTLSREISHLSERLDGGESLEAALEAIFQSEGIEIQETREARYQCDCSRERIGQVLLATGRQELTDMIEKDGGAEVVCHFCNTAYRFSAEELTELRDRATGD